MPYSYLEYMQDIFVPRRGYVLKIQITKLRVTKC
jgi:hypothetical protein